jgi:hypothetical protein
VPSLHRAVAPAGWEVEPPEIEEPPDDPPEDPPDDPPLVLDLWVAGGLGLAVVVTVTVARGVAVAVTVTAGRGAAVVVAVAVTVTAGRGAELAALGSPPPNARPIESSAKPPIHTRLRRCSGRASGMRGGRGGGAAHCGPETCCDM